MNKRKAKVVPITKQVTVSIIELQKIKAALQTAIDMSDHEVFAQMLADGDYESLSGSLDDYLEYTDSWNLINNKEKEIGVVEEIELEDHYKDVPPIVGRQ
tara:strand:+ start:36 stop:335 length:300 start_codon:yes stop_codon:yes gene_type:complete